MTEEEARDHFNEIIDGYRWQCHLRSQQTMTTDISIFGGPFDGWVVTTDIDMFGPPRQGQHSMRTSMEDGTTWDVTYERIGNVEVFVCASLYEGDSPCS